MQLKSVLNRARKALIHWQRVALAKGLLRWIQNVYELVRMRRLTQKLLSRMAQRDLSKAFDRWYCNVNTLLEEEADMERKNDLMRRILHRMIGRDLSRAWVRWKENTLERKLMVTKSTRVVMRWKNAATACCLDAWHQHVQEEGRKRDLLRRVVLRMQNRTAAIVFQGWCTSILEHRRLRSLMIKVKSRMLNRSASIMFECWSRYTEVNAVLRHLRSHISCRARCRLMIWPSCAGPIAGTCRELIRRGGS